MVSSTLALLFFFFFRFSKCKLGSGLRGTMSSRIQRRFSPSVHPSFVGEPNKHTKKQTGETNKENRKKHTRKKHTVDRRRLGGREKKERVAMGREKFPGRKKQ